MQTQRHEQNNLPKSDDVHEGPKTKTEVQTQSQVQNNLQKTDGVHEGPSYKVNVLKSKKYYECNICRNQKHMNMYITHSL